MNITETVLTALVMLLGEEGKDYIFLDRDMEEWNLVSWVHRN